MLGSVEQPGDYFVRAMDPLLRHVVDGVAKTMEMDGQTLREGFEVVILREMRRVAAVSGALGSLLAFQAEDPAEGLRDYARICACYVTADPALDARLQAILPTLDNHYRPILEELLAWAERIRMSAPPPPGSNSGGAGGAA